MYPASKNAVMDSRPELSKIAPMFHVKWSKTASA